MKRRKCEVVCLLRWSKMTLRVNSKAELLANTSAELNMKETTTVNTVDKSVGVDVDIEKPSFQKMQYLK